MTLGRIIVHVHGDSCSIISRRWLTRLFVTGDVLSFFIQAGGGGYEAAGSLDASRIGNDIIIVGLFFQLASFGVFIIVAAIFHARLDVRCKQDPAYAEAISGGKGLWLRQMVALYCGSCLIFVRSTFRIVEYLMGNDGYTLRHEVFLYVFDALLMLLTMVVFLVTHPSQMTRPIRKSESFVALNDNAESFTVSNTI